jgi:hypothetical protein
MKDIPPYRRMTLWELGEIGISSGSRHAILTQDLRMHIKSQQNLCQGTWLKIKEFNVFQFATKTSCDDRMGTVPFKVIIGDDTCVYGYDVETKWQSSLWKSPDSVSPEILQVRSKMKYIYTSIFLIIAALITMSSFQWARQLVPYQKFWKRCGMWFKQNNTECGLQNTASSSQQYTCSQLTHHYWFKISW